MPKASSVLSTMFLLVTRVDRVFMTHIESDIKSKVFKKLIFTFCRKFCHMGDTPGGYVRHSESPPC